MESSAKLVLDTFWQHRSTCAALFAAAYGGQMMLSQYWVLLNRNLPRYSLEPPFLGCFLKLFWDGYVTWARRVLAEGPAMLTNFFGYNTVVVSWPLYDKHVRRADQGGQLEQGNMPQSMVKLLGEHSILLLRAGKGQEPHHRLRGKVLASLSPKRVLALVPEMTAIIRDILDRMVADTATTGFACFEAYASEVPQRITAVPILGRGIPTELALRFGDLVNTWTLGLLALPVNLGRFTSYGRALQARSEMVGLLKEMMAHSQADNVLGDLAASTAEGTGFAEAEIVDTIFTLLFAGQFTTSDALPPLLVELARRAEWAERIAAEPLEFEQVEGDGVTVNFVREVLRHYPPEVVFFRRNNSGAISLGEHGQVPLGCNVMMNFGDAMWRLGEDFNPDRWSKGDIVRESFLTFGGSSPHSCVGRSLAMVELQLFARILCKEYRVEVLDEERVRSWKLAGITKAYRGGCKVKLTKRA